MSHTRLLTPTGRLIRPLWLPLLTLLGTSLACQGSGNAPTTSSLPGTTPTPALAPALTEGDSAEVSFGIWRVKASAEGVEMLPVRDSTLLGDSYALDATQFFNQSPCSTCLRITHFELVAEDQIDLDIRLAHPFPDQSKRADLDVFDPRLIVVAPALADYGALSFPGTPGYIPAPGELNEPLRANTNLLRNASGYTTHFDRRVNELLGVSWDGNLNPYIDFAEDLDPGPGVLPNPNHRLSQASPPETQTFQLTLPSSGVLEFALVLEVSYGESALKPTRLSPAYYTPEFNRKEAHDITGDFPLGNVINRAHGSSLPIRVRVADWQHSETVDPAYPQVANPAGLKQSSRVMQVYLEAPTLFTGSLSNNISITGSGTQASPLVYPFTVPRTRNLPPPAGKAPVLVTVVDELHNSAQSIPESVGNYGYTQDVRGYQILYLEVEEVGRFEALSPAYTLFSVGQMPQAAYGGGPAGRPDIAVYNNGKDRSGVYIPGSNNVLRRYPLWYGIEDITIVDSAPVTGTGLLPFNDYGGTNPHPAPGNFMPIRAVDATDNGSVILAYDDPNFTFDPARIANTALTIELPNDSIVTFFDNALGDMRSSPRFLAEAGSAGAIGAPAYGERVMNVAEPGLGFLSATSPLTWMAGGPATELDGDTVQWFMWNAPFSNQTNRVLSGDVDPNVLSSGMPSAWTDLVAYDIGTYQSGSGSARQLMYVLDRTGDLHVLDVLANIGENRQSNPIIEFTGSVQTVGSWDVVDIQVLEFNPARPLVANGFTQQRDWFAVLFRNQDPGDPGGKLRIMEYVPGGLGFSLIQQFHDGGGASTHPYLSNGAAEPVALDVDDINGAIHITFDSNGMATPGGDILVTVIAPL